ncbi:MAG: hypothetical protein ACI4LI_02730 [Candidatus Fimenecus sp.]
MEKPNTFEYTYSAPQQAEIKKIREKYLPKAEREDKLEQLRRLDRSVERPGMIAALTLGIVGMLIFGTGLCCVMVWARFVLGVAVGTVGIAVAAVAYPVYKRIHAERRRKVAPLILKLTEELENPITNSK